MCNQYQNIFLDAPIFRDLGICKDRTFYARFTANWLRRNAYADSQGEQEKQRRQKNKLHYKLQCQFQESCTINAVNVKLKLLAPKLHLFLVLTAGANTPESDW